MNRNPFAPPDHDDDDDYNHGAIWAAGYPIGREYPTTTRQAGVVLYQLIALDGATLAIRDRWVDSETAKEDPAERLPALAFRRRFAGRRYSIAGYNEHLHGTMRHRCRGEMLAVLEDQGPLAVLTRTDLRAHMYDETSWASPDIREALEWALELGYIRMDEEGTDITRKGRRVRPWSQVIVRPLGFTGDDEHDEALALAAAKSEKKGQAA